MKYLLVLLIVGLLPIIGFYVGNKLGRAKPDLTRIEKKELEKRRDFMSDLGARAAEHAMLGDNFAVIVQGMLADERKGIR
jgi:hypothetical protein